jgi:F0F1-type ATP synthase assembly protein I
MKDPVRTTAVLARMLGLAFLIPACLLTGYAIGYALDRHFGAEGFSLAGLLIGIAAGFVQLIREISKKPS